jgi:hypothetical protein
MKKIITLIVIFLLFLPGMVKAQGYENLPPMPDKYLLPDGSVSSALPFSGGILTDSNCNQSKYFPHGVLCQDTDDGKLYKGTGAAVQVVEFATTAEAVRYFNNGFYSK